MTVSDTPINPFVALRVAYGMLLGEEDFQTLIGHPRGKQMLHNAWLHGGGVVWGYDVRVDGLWSLLVSPGLAQDGLGRELLNERTATLDLRTLVDQDAADEHDPGSGVDPHCRSWTVHGCCVLDFSSCLSAPVPTLADPCDVTREHDDYSRVLERARISLRLDCPEPRRTYHRVRVLLGLEPVGDDDPAGEEAAEARARVDAAEPGRRAEVTLHEFSRLAAQDSIDLQPAPEPGESYPSWFPVTEDDAAVVLARVAIDLRERDGCPEILRVRVDPGARSVLLPTATIAELCCGLAPGLLGDSPVADDPGPRVVGDLVQLSDDALRLVIPVTGPLAVGSVARSVTITSLSLTRSAGWVLEDIDETSYEPQWQPPPASDGTEPDPMPAIVVRLADRPANDLVRVVVRGTGAKPVLGHTGIPLAGVVGGPPGTRYDGTDAVWTLVNPVTKPQADSSSPEEVGA